MGKDAKEAKDRSGEQELIRELAGLLNETGLTEIEIEKSGLKVRVARTASVAAAVAPPAVAPAPGVALIAAGQAAMPTATASHAGALKSPMVGTAYRSPEPGAPPFVEVGAKVSQGQTVLIIEAMKVMNQIPAPRSGTVTQILVSDKDPVQFEQTLMVIE